MQGFCKALSQIQKKYNLKLLGGDIVKTNKMAFSVTVFGKITKNQILLRKNAKIDQEIYVSNYIGDSFLGLTASKKSKNYDYFQNKHFLIDPQIKLGQELLRQSLSDCAIDISDGLLADLQHICNQSNLDAKINLENIPISNQALNYLDINKNISKLDLISGGEDFQLIFSAKKENSCKIQILADKLQIKLTKIGHFKEKTFKNPKITLLNSNNKKITIKKYGFSH